MAVGSMQDEGGISGSASGRRRLPHPLALAWFLFLAVLLSGIIGISFFGSDDRAPLRLELELAPPPKPAPHHVPPVTASTKAAAPTANTASGSTLPQTATPTGQQAAQAAGTAVTLPPAVVPAKVMKPVFAGSELVADPALIETTGDGPLPRISADGRKPMLAYAPAVPAAELSGKKKIAIVVSGLGISARATAAALAGLPAGVTLAFAPYDTDVQHWVTEARRRGHEVLLEIPMEPYDFPDSDPGPHTLRPTLNSDDNISRLKWALTRFTGYAGVTNLLGGRFLASGEATEPVMQFLASRGLMFYDSGTSARSAAAASAASAKTPYVDGSLQLDAIQSGMEIDQKLNELKDRARKQGYAVGTGFLYPVTIARIAAWARNLRSEGFVLVPASAIVSPNP